MTKTYFWSSAPVFCITSAQTVPIACLFLPQNTVKELEKKAQIELNEVASRVQDDLKHVRDWLGKQMHVKAKTDDQTLIAFLRNAKFSLERTKEKVEAFYTLKTISMQVLKERNPYLPEIQDILKKR